MAHPGVAKKAELTIYALQFRKFTNAEGSIEHVLYCDMQDAFPNSMNTVHANGVPRGISFYTDWMDVIGQQLLSSYVLFIVFITISGIPTTTHISKRCDDNFVRCEHEQANAESTG